MTEPGRILVVDDDRETCRFIEELLRGPARTIELAYTPDEALTRARAAGFDVVVSDINLNADRNGIDLLRSFKDADPAVEVVLLSGFGTLETAIAAVRAGAFDYISKPFDIAEVQATVDRALRRRRQAGTPPPRVLPGESLDADGFIGRSGKMLAVYKQIAHASASAAPVLITGETGTGKELVARAIHRHGARAARPFVAVNCGALPESLLESELFGHVRGAFTGAVADKRGLFEQARGGTLFLDEIGETTPALQVRLLRVVELGEMRPVGSSSVLTVDVRVLAATHRDLEAMVESGAFRQDLFYRLNVFRIQVPALRERREDVPLLVAHFLRQAASRRAGPVTPSPEVLAALAARDWPGNVRELESAVERLVLSSRSGSLDLGDLPAALRERGPDLEEKLFAGLPPLDEVERRYLQHVLQALGGNRSRAAQVLGIDRRTLYRMAERFGLDRDDGGS